MATHLFIYVFFSFTSLSWVLENPPPRPLVSSPCGLSLSQCPSGLGISMTTRISATVESGCHSGSMFCSILWILASASKKNKTYYNKLLSLRGDLWSFSCMYHTRGTLCTCESFLYTITTDQAFERWTNEANILTHYFNVSHFHTEDFRNRRYKM